MIWIEFFLFFSNIFDWITNSNVNSIHYDNLNTTYQINSTSAPTFSPDIISEYITSLLPKMTLPIITLSIALLSYIFWLATCKCFNRKYSNKCSVLQSAVIYVVVGLSLLAAGISVVNNVQNSNINHQIFDKINQPVTNLISVYDEIKSTFGNVNYDNLLPYIVMQEPDTECNDTLCDAKNVTIYNTYDQNKLLYHVSIIDTDLKIFDSGLNYINFNVTNIDKLYVILSYSYVINVFIFIILSIFLGVTFKRYKDKKYENISQYLLDTDKSSEIEGKCLPIKKIYSKIKQNSNNIILNILIVLFIIFYVLFCVMFAITIFVGDVDILTRDNNLLKRYGNDLILYKNISLVDTIDYYLSCGSKTNPFVAIFDDIAIFVRDEYKDVFDSTKNIIASVTDCSQFSSDIKYAMSDIIEQLSYSMKTIIVAHVLIYVAILVEIIMMMIISKFNQDPKTNTPTNMRELVIIKNGKQHYYLTDEIKSINENAYKIDTLKNLSSISC